MMFIRHGMFARKSVVERRRKLIIGASIGLLLVTTAVIYAVVKAAGSFDLAYVDASNPGLTSGNITGTLTKTDNSAATNVDRDGKIKLHLEFNFTNDVINNAKDADAWTYDLGDIVSNNASIASIDNVTTPVDIVNDGVVIAKYTVTNGVATVVPEKTTEAINWWADHTSNVKVGFTVNLNLDKVGVGTHDSDSFVLPGTVTPSNASGNSTDLVYYDTPHVAIHEYVYDEDSQSFKVGNYDKLIDVEKVGNDYIATYNTNFYTDVYAQDLKVTIALAGDQTLTSDGFVMKTCTTNNCIHDSSVTTISIPSNYVTISADNKTAEINMEGFLYDYCEVGGHDCTGAGIGGYTLNDAMSSNNANGSDYYIQYKANLGSTDPAGNGKTYSATATITGNNGALTAADTVRYGVGFPGSKTGTCKDASGTSYANCSDIEGDVYIDYVITVGEAGTDLSKTTIIDRITDNQVLASDITLASPSGSTTTIAQATACSSDSDNDCIVAAAVDANYSSNSQKLFSHAFGAGDVGVWTVSYRVKVATDAVLGSKNIDNKIDLKLDQTTYTDVWTTTTNYDFATPMYIEKVQDYTHVAEGLVHWTITVYGPSTGTMNNANVTDTLWYDKNTYPTGTISTTIDNATKTVGGATTSITGNNSEYTTSVVNDNLVINIPTINAGEVYTFGITTQADSTFKAAYAGESVQLQNQACRDVDNRCSEQVRTTILTPDADVLTKTAEESDDIFYWKLEENNNKYVYSRRTGYLWKVTINPDAGSVTDSTRSDYEPYFTDTIPAGLYLTYRYNENGMPEPTCVTAGACDASVDIDQSKYSTVINVRRIIPSLSGQTDQNKDVVVNVVNGVIQPINLAAVFNENCSIPSNTNPTLTCAGINGAKYEVTYATALPDAIYNDMLNAHTFQNQAKLQELTSTNPDAYTDRANGVATVTYKNASAIEKSDPTAQALESTNKITYVITVNKAGYAYLNNGEPYESGATRPMLIVTDHISDDVNILTTPFSATNLGDNSANNTLSSSTNAIICTDINDVIVNDCSFNYNSETRVLTAQIPDGLVRKIWYSVVVANPIPNKTSYYENTAVMHANNVDFSSKVGKNHTVNAEAGYIIGDGTPKIKKVNADNVSEVVEGAEFKLVQVAYDASTGALGAETVIDLNASDPNKTNGVTNANGIVEFSGLCGYSTGTQVSPCENGGQLYYWQEISAPAPYIPTDGTTKHYFVLYNEENLATGTEANRAVAQYVANIVEENGSNNVAVEVLNSNYQWIVTNIKQEETSIAIEKKVTGNTARVEDTFTITVTATDLAGEPLTGTYKYDTYFTSDPAGTLTEGDTISFTNGSASFNLDHGRGIVIYGLYVGGTYTVTESNNTGYAVSYVCSDLSGDGCTSAASNSGTFVEDAGAAAAISAGNDPDFEDVGQIVTLTNDSSTEITGISNKKPSVAIAVIFGGTVAGLGVFIARKFRH